MKKPQKRKPVPKADRWDAAYKAAKLAVGSAGVGVSLATGIPLGGLGLNLFEFAVKPPVQKRIMEFLDQVAEDLNRLNIETKGLSNNLLFVTTLTQGLQIAMRNHQPEKLDALRSAVLNSATPQFIDDNLTLMFLHWIDVFTPWHMRVLNYLGSNPTSVYLDYLSEDERLNIDLIISQLRDKFPGDEIDIQFLNQVTKDLSDRGLVTIKTVRQTDSGEMPVDAVVTNMGEKFLDFITTIRL